MSKEIYYRISHLIHHHNTHAFTPPGGPIGLLPTEVLSNIFLHCVSQAVQPTSPLVLTQVCSSWRKIALCIPKLWTNLNLSLTVQPTLPQTSPFVSPSPQQPAGLKTPSSLADLASLWFERAGNHLLSISINLIATSPSAAYNDLSSSFIEPLLSNASSIQHLSIRLTSQSQLEGFFASSGVEFINLRSLSLSVGHLDAHQTPPIIVFRNSPRLSNVSFDLNGVPPSPSFIHLPWFQLEHFNMTGASIFPADALNTLLTSCTNLQQAVLWVEDPSDANYTVDESTTTTLPNLTHLTLSFYGRREKTARSLLTAFDLPNLRHFKCFSGFITLPFMPATIITSHTLESLVLSGLSLSAADFLTLATGNPFLRSITLDLRYFNDNNVFHLLDILAAGRPTSPRVLPSLSNLSLWTRSISPYSAAYTHMIRARGRWVSSRLRSSPPSSMTTKAAEPLHLSLFLARQQHGVCCYFATCDKASTNVTGSSSTHLDDILAVVEVGEHTEGVELYVRDVRPDQGIAL